MKPARLQDIIPNVFVGLQKQKKSASVTYLDYDDRFKVAAFH
jgi:hypothetical protein